MSLPLWLWSCAAPPGCKLLAAQTPDAVESPSGCPCCCGCCSGTSLWLLAALVVLVPCELGGQIAALMAANLQAGGWMEGNTNSRHAALSGLLVGTTHGCSRHTSFCTLPAAHLRVSSGDCCGCGPLVALLPPTNCLNSPLGGVPTTGTGGGEAAACAASSAVAAADAGGSAATALAALPATPTA